MRLHSDTLTFRDIRNAARRANVSIIVYSEHGSRRRKGAHEVALSGSSPYRSQADRNEYAATWDEWGIFLAALFETDPDMSAQYYPTREDFERITGGRFDTLKVEDQHKRHRWIFDGAALSCHCGAVQSR